jgi:hypothetical protein
MIGTFTRRRDGRTSCRTGGFLRTGSRMRARQNRKKRVNSGTNTAKAIISGINNTKVSREIFIVL